MNDPNPYFKVSVELVNGRLPDHMLDWLEINVGPVIDDSDVLLQVQGEGWSAWGQRYVGRESLITFFFEDMRKATLFKLSM